MLPKREQLELMAPAGSWESLQAAIQAGADSVYFGIGRLNMRSRSSHHFNLGDLKKIKEISRKKNVRTYIALNSVIYNDELDQVREIIHAARESGINAVIASDHSVITMARRENLPVHLSTQLNISNIESLKFYSGFADVMVLARELNLGQITEMAEAIRHENIRGSSGLPLKLELFVHGALCMAVSGKCYLSLHQYGHSANRGECFQACRRTYTVIETETGKALEIDREQIMSPKDLCTISFLDRIIQTGITVLKIEGRARSPEYVSTVTACYNEALEAVCRGSFNRQKIREWEKRLAGVFNRGFWEGYYLGQEQGEWSGAYGSLANRRKIYIGRVMNYFSKQGVGEFLVETGELSSGDEILITGPTTGVMESAVSEMKVNRENVMTASRGDHVTIPVPGVIRRSDKLYKVVAASQVKLQ